MSNKIQLKEMVGGALQAKFAHSFEKVMENMLDPNMPYKDKREIVIKMKFVQNEARDNIVSEITVTEKLASQSALTTQFAVGKDLRTGEIVAEEYGKQLKGQLSMESMIESVDSETGEITESRSVVDFRKVQGE